MQIRFWRILDPGSGILRSWIFGSVLSFQFFEDLPRENRFFSSQPEGFRANPRKVPPQTAYANISSIYKYNVKFIREISDIIFKYSTYKKNIIRYNYKEIFLYF